MTSIFNDDQVFKNKEVCNVGLAGKTIGIFFVSFSELGSITHMPLMKKFFKNKDDFGLHDFEIVIASLDENESDYNLLIDESDAGWYYLEYQNPLIKELYEKYNVDQLPALVVVRFNGDIVTKNGVPDIVTAYSLFDGWI
ncbi:hypothetical protein PENTCL1PPCAC_8106 [Pristionchus entomophagus]|uniref:protein-disulfide reductase n=1 Tax=Pristionchus entomophagus TaxID=358040 RepID=A0AAV5SRC7_9BILA|nr:hypothetical protein PENTCL1PPCAC_8106 [Pristionchus entomophagus]